MVALLMAGCSEVEIDNGQQQKGLMPVLFSAGSMDATVTRASASASYMPVGSFFVCSMFFHAGANDTDSSAFYSDQNPLIRDVNMMTASLKIDNENGNAAYQGNTFYWQNRKDHVFLALADNNKLADEQEFNDSIISFDLTRGSKDTISKQPDPILAYVKMKPSGSTQEANRVKLFFQHQFAQVQVNLKSALDSTTENIEIKKIELLGVSPKGYVAYGINPDGSLPKPNYEPTTTTTTFEMFQNKTSIPTGYLKSFECIAFGMLHGIQVTWTESAAEGGTTHTVIYNVNMPLELKSGNKYIYNMELRRSQIAKVDVKVKAWTDGKTYGAEGTIK